ncbi:type IVB secretion system protein IcmH/DotU [Pseudomonas gingeri]|uniref:type IVB secretion system protein IcmH/DotU n=1 Tax=Pseudomonas gingeri TaxID=117681 RepID=UPI0015A25122|nr:type IVB secretion system protein IcmH/DotU [Pseudomonas gingeri]NWD08822.1 DotU family type IV/VI secretion system protein [Pseudomonas gingeri]NWE34328.1 DotU family type IV/VI secretion system protein [Pseudomonas gingeri]NWE56413.1 DotU family type IV/VI secretion system protein [Pseudomonas gingeri]NWF05453.1 DotU family type IV/VI secretion system protein [Pseudomonas gingeri]
MNEAKEHGIYFESKAEGSESVQRARHTEIELQRVTPEFQMRGLAWNPLCDAAMPLMGLAIRLQTLDRHDDIPALYLSIHNQITTIMEEVRPLDYEPGSLKAYSYTLCLLMDESVMSTSWGKHSEWSQRSLLSAFHQESWGGEKFFTLLARMSTAPTKYQHTLEFMYLCLCMGIKGKYGNQSNGAEEMQRIITQLHGILRQLRGAPPRHLTEPLAHITSRNYHLKRMWPLWTPWVLAALVLTTAYMVYNLRLSAITREVLASLDGILKL